MDKFLKDYSDTHSAKAMVLTCIDYRFIDNTFFYLEDSEYANKYDATSLAGSSLGFNQKKYKNWRSTFVDHVKLAIDLHHIEEILVFDHMDCGAYKMFYPKLKTPEKEEKKHIKNIKKFCKKMKCIFPKLKCSGYLLSLDGIVTKII